jgi:hypothetical protein
MNNTNIILDDTFKTELKIFYNAEVKPCYDEQSLKLCEVMNRQNDLRTRIQKYLLPKLHFTKGTKNSLSNMYAIFLVLLLKDRLESVVDWSDLLGYFKDEFDIVQNDEGNVGIKTELFNIYDVNIDYPFRCCCGRNGCVDGQLIENSNISFVVGSVCMNKVGIRFEKIMKRKLEKHKKDIETMNIFLKAIPIQFGKYKDLTYYDALTKNIGYFKYLASKGFFQDEKYGINTWVLKYLRLHENNQLTIDK